MSAISIITLIISIATLAALAFLFYKFYDVVKKTNMSKGAFKGHKKRALNAATEAGKRDWENLVFDVPELKEIFPDLANSTLQKGAINPGLFTAGLLGSLGDLAPLIGMVQNKEINLTQLLPIIINQAPTILKLIRERRKNSTSNTKFLTEKSVTQTQAITDYG